MTNGASEKNRTMDSFLAVDKSLEKKKDEKILIVVGYARTLSCTVTTS